MAVRAGDLNRRITFSLPKVTGRTDKGGPITTLESMVTVWAARKDVSDRERIAAQQLGATLTTRFVVRYSSQTKAIDPRHIITCDGRSYDISGVKEIGFREGFEFTATVRTDTPRSAP